MSSIKKIEDLYQQMADLTRPKCLECKSGWQNKCCDKMYCEIAQIFAKENGVDIEFTDNSIPFLDSNNKCIVPPHLRPLCTLHSCGINSIGTSGDNKWDDQYFKLREEIEKEENIIGRHAYVYH